MANYKFSKDLIIGQKGEDIILEQLKLMGGRFVSRGDDNKHDLTLLYKDKLVTYECKTDLFPDTGNYFVETKCRNKLSGIYVTKADYFVTYFVKSNEIWFIKTDKLKSIVNNGDSHKKVFYAGDANSGTEAFLIKKWKYKKDFLVVNVSPLVSENLLLFQSNLSHL